MDSLFQLAWLKVTKFWEFLSPVLYHLTAGLLIPDILRGCIISIFMDHKLFEP